MKEVVLEVRGVSKKFCAHLKWSMFYGITDVLKTVFGMKLSPELRKHEFRALDNVSLSLRKGEILGLLGRNGSGKTTLMRLIAGIYPSDTGEILIGGRIASLFAVTAGMNPLFSGRENIFIRGSFFGMTTAEIREKLDWIIEFSELGEFIDAPMGTYSSGMRARLGYSIAVATNPDLLIVDEGLAVGDAAFRNKCFHHLRQISADCGVIFISHNINQINKVANRIIVLENGVITFATDDIASGIDFYTRSGVKGKAQEKSSSEIIRHVQYPREVNYGGVLEVSIEYSGAVNTDAVWIVQIFDANRRLVAENESPSGLFDMNEGPRQTTFCTDRLQLKPDMYFLTVGIMDKNSNSYLGMYNTSEPFQVKGYFQGNVPYQIDVNWKVK